MYGVRTVVPVLLLVAVVAGALAMWSDTLKINATIKTGDVDIEFVGTPRVFEGDEYDKPWVASCAAELVEVQNEDEGNPAGNNDLELSITVSNAYPCYYCKVHDVAVENIGTIPVKLKVSVYIDNVECERRVDPRGQYYYFCDADGNGEADVVLWGCITSLEGVQLEPEKTISFTVDLHVEQDAEELKTYVIKIFIKGIQWNEY